MSKADGVAFYRWDLVNLLFVRKDVVAVFLGSLPLKAGRVAILLTVKWTDLKYICPSLMLFNDFGNIGDKEGYVVLARIRSSAETLETSVYQIINDLS